MSNWFERIFGFSENPTCVNEQFLKITTNEHIILKCKKTSKDFFVGSITTPSTEQLNNSLIALNPSTLKGLSVQHIVGNVYDLHQQIENKDAVFQVASQFNCLEMASPNIMPSDGITCYADDRTQGPQCAMACPAGTLYRNYYLNMPKQINTLHDIEKIIHNKKHSFWQMQNGYIVPKDSTSINKLNKRIIRKAQHEKIYNALRVGVHYTSVISQYGTPSSHNVYQVYCSAIPVSYTRRTTTSGEWSLFANIILRSAYDATLALATMIARKQNRRVRVFLTKLGNGAFGNETEWIIEAITLALEKYKSEPLDVFIVHYRCIDTDFVNAMEK